MTLGDGNKTEVHTGLSLQQTPLQDKFTAPTLHGDLEQSYSGSDKSSNALNVFTDESKPKAGNKFSVFSDNNVELLNHKSEHFDLDGQTANESSSKKLVGQFNILNDEAVSKVEDNKFGVFCDDDKESSSTLKSNYSVQSQTSNESANKSSIKFNIFSDEAPPEEEKFCINAKQSKPDESNCHLSKPKFNIFSDETAHSDIDKESKVTSKPPSNDKGVKFGVFCDEDEKPKASTQKNKPGTNFQIFSDESVNKKSSAIPGRTEPIKIPKFDILCDEGSPEEVAMVEKFKPLKKPSTKFGIFIDDEEPSASKIQPKVVPPAPKIKSAKKFNIFSDESVSKPLSKFKVFSEEEGKKPVKEDGSQRTSQSQNDQVPLHIKKSIFPQSHKLKR
jgi:hypothetical protein